MRWLILFFMSAAAEVAQTASTQILGLVTDATGAIVPNAVVTARRIETGDVRNTASNDTGNYLSSGRFRLVRGDVRRRRIQNGSAPRHSRGVEPEGPHRLSDAGGAGGGNH